MSDEISSGEGGDPPNKVDSMRRRRSRKLSGVAHVALGDLAFAMYEVAGSNLPGDAKWHMLRAKLLAWRARYL